MDADEDDGIGLSLGRLLGECQAVAYEARDILNLALLVVMSENHCIERFLKAPDFLLEVDGGAPRGGCLHIACLTTGQPGSQHWLWRFRCASSSIRSDAAHGHFQGGSEDSRSDSGSRGGDPNGGPEGAPRIRCRRVILAPPGRRISGSAVRSHYGGWRGRRPDSGPSFRSGVDRQSRLEAGSVFVCQGWFAARAPAAPGTGAPAPGRRADAPAGNHLTASIKNRRIRRGRPGVLGPTRASTASDHQGGPGHFGSTDCSAPRGSVASVIGATLRSPRSRCGAEPEYARGILTWLPPSTSLGCLVGVKAALESERRADQPRSARRIRK